jgi:hypothetical protein
MNDNQTTTETVFHFRRLSEGFTVFGWELPSWLWVLALVVVLALGIAYVVAMYVKDSRSVHWAFAVFLGMLRCMVYGVLAMVFLLPSCQSWERAERRSRVVVVLDASESIALVSDDIPSANRPVEKLETRLDKILQFLDDDSIAFLSRLSAKNPVVVYRFGSRLDEDTHTIRGGDPKWPRDEWQKWLKLNFKHWVVQGLSENGRQLVIDSPAFEADKPGTAEWALQWLRRGDDIFPPLESGFTDADRQKLKESRDKLDKRVEVVRQLLQGTNVGDSVLGVVNREANNMVQGLVVISDGRSTHGSDSSLAELRIRARRENIPVFTVIVGEDRLPVSIQIVDVQTPEQAPPNEKFVIRAEIDGIGLPGKKKPVYLDIFLPGEDPKKAKPVHTIEGEVTFQPGEPPHGQVEFNLDPTATDGKDKLPQELFKSADAIAKERTGDEKDKPKEESKAPSKNVRELIEGEWKFAVRVPKDDGEAFLDKEHKSDIASVQIIKKAIRVLLFAGGPTRDFQFVRTMLVREKDQKRAEISVFLQNEGRDGRDVQDVEPERRLNRFPTTLLLGDAAAKLDPKDKYYNLDQYDVIIAFDPDWSELLPEQFNLLKTWIENQAGGLIIVAGPVHTYQVASAEDGGKFKVLQELFPVIPGDSRLPLHGGTRRNTKKPWYLNFPGAKDQEFLKLDDDKNHPLAGWDEFFFRKERRDERDTEAKYGFFDFYPVQSVKKGADVVATFADPQARLPNGDEHPYLVTLDYPKGKIVYLGGEMYRLRSRKIEYYERFWVKLARYASAGTRVRGSSKRGVLVMGKQFSAGSFVRMEAQMFGADSNPLPETIETKAFITPLTSSDPKDRKEIKLSPKRSAVTWSGWFQGRHLVEKPGEYLIEVPIPGSPDSLRGKITVKESNPELDHVRPDPLAMYQIASDIDEVLPRLANKATADDLRKAVEGRRVRAEKQPGIPSASEAEPDRSMDKPRLCFDLKTAGIIPECMLTDTKLQRNKGKSDDLWDKGVIFGYDNRNAPIRLPYVLLLVVGLLSCEWLTRKLLRLA